MKAQGCGTYCGRSSLAARRPLRRTRLERRSRGHDPAAFRAGGSVGWHQQPRGTPPHTSKQSSLRRARHEPARRELATRRRLHAAGRAASHAGASRQLMWSSSRPTQGTTMASAELCDRYTTYGRAPTVALGPARRFTAPTVRFGAQGPLSHAYARRDRSPSSVAVAERRLTACARVLHALSLMPSPPLSHVEPLTRPPAPCGGGACATWRRDGKIEWRHQARRPLVDVLVVVLLRFWAPARAARGAATRAEHRGSP